MKKGYNKKIAIAMVVVLVLICILVCFLIFRPKWNIKDFESSNSGGLKELTDNSMFTIYLDGKEYTISSTWPEEAKFQKADCINENGETILESAITFDESKKKIYVKNVNQTTYCYLYFESCKGPVGTVLEGKSQVSKCDIGGMYRYQGTDDVNNYICFGTVNKDVCINGGDSYGDGIDKYMYRIIGVTPEGELKLIKETIIKEGNMPIFQWNGKDSATDCGSDGEKCSWPYSKLFNRINGLCNAYNQADCKNTTAGSSGDTNIFIGNSYYEYLTDESEWLDIISNYTWKYGDTTNYNNYNGNTTYSIESQFPNSIEAKIGLQYIYDYLYAYPGGNPGRSANAKKAWIHFAKDGYNSQSGEWLITRIGYNESISGGIKYNAVSERSNGQLLSNGVTSINAVRPVFYLENSVKIKSGTGSKTDPYIIDGIIEKEYTANFYIGSGKNSTVSMPSAYWYAKWTLPNATHYCVTTSSTSSSCSWSSLSAGYPQPIGGTLSFSNPGKYTYYFYVKNAAGQIASDSDTVTVIDNTVTEPEEPEPSGSAPTCSLTVSSSGVTLSKSSDATEYGMSTSSTPTYNSNTSLNITYGEFYGFVKNAYGTGSCRASIIYTTQGNSGSTYYTWTEAQCIKTGSNDTYKCCKDATSSGTKCPSGYSKVGSYCAKNGTDPTCPNGTTFSSSVDLCRSYTPFVCPNGTSDNGTTCSKVIAASQTNYGNLQQCTKQCSKGDCTNSGVCISCPNGDHAFTHIDGVWSCRTSVAKNSCPSGYIAGPNQCYKNSGSPTCGSKTNINGKCYDTTSPTSGGYTCSSSSDSLSGSQCCRTSSSQISGYSCSVTSSTPVYEWGQSNSNSGSSCPTSATTCNQNNLGGKKISNCQPHQSGETYYYCSDSSYTWLNNSFCYKIYN